MFGVLHYFDTRFQSPPFPHGQIKIPCTWPIYSFFRSFALLSFSTCGLITVFFLLSFSPLFLSFSPSLFFSFYSSLLSFFHSLFLFLFSSPSLFLYFPRPDYWKPHARVSPSRSIRSCFRLPLGTFPESVSHHSVGRIIIKLINNDYS